MSDIGMMKRIILLLIIFASCDQRQQPRRDDLGEILSSCKGHAIVSAKGFNEGNMKSRQHYLIIIDDSMNAYEYFGAKYDVEVGDTLK
jgi:hypothetical protein